MKKISKKNAEILAFVNNNDGAWSYQLIADHFGVSRNIVAGLVFRARHPFKTRVASPRAVTPNKIGTGYRPQSYKPDLHARNTR